jgi:hypothetical protein
MRRIHAHGGTLSPQLRVCLSAIELTEALSLIKERRSARGPVGERPTFHDETDDDDCSLIDGGMEEELDGSQNAASCS